MAEFLIYVCNRITSEIVLMREVFAQNTAWDGVTDLICV